MAFLVGKAVDLVFDRRAITRANAFDHPGIHRRAIEVGRDDFVSPGIGVGNPATDLLWMQFLGAHERHDRDRRVASLLGHDREIHRPRINTWWRTGFQAPNTQGQFA
ncbi:hypothetical protein D3C73_1487110 [compost metagenome]